MYVMFYHCPYCCRICNVNLYFIPNIGHSSLLLVFLTALLLVYQFYQFLKKQVSFMSHPSFHLTNLLLSSNKVILFQIRRSYFSKKKKYLLSGWPRFIILFFPSFLLDKDLDYLRSHWLTVTNFTCLYYITVIFIAGFHLLISRNNFW